MPYLSINIMGWITGFIANQTLNAATAGIVQFLGQLGTYSPYLLLVIGIAVFILADPIKTLVKVIAAVVAVVGFLIIISSIL